MFWQKKDDGEAPRMGFVEVGADNIFTEQFMALRSRIEYRGSTHQTKVLAVTSAVAGEGKTITCANLAPSLVSRGRNKVLLIDADLRKSDLANRLGITPRPGLSEFLSGGVPESEIMRDSSVPGLSVIPAGARVASPGDLLAGDQFRALIDDARQKFDMVVIDTPPLVPVADTLTLRDLVDGFVFVFRIGHTPHTLLRQAVDDLGAAKVLGVILNGVEPFKEKYYEKYYGPYYKGAASERRDD